MDVTTGPSRAHSVLSDRAWSVPIHYSLLIEENSPGSGAAALYQSFSVPSLPELFETSPALLDVDVRPGW